MAMDIHHERGLDLAVIFRLSYSGRPDRTVQLWLNCSRLSCSGCPGFFIDFCGDYLLDITTSERGPAIGGSDFSSRISDGVST